MEPKVQTDVVERK